MCLYSFTNFDFLHYSSSHQPCLGEARKSYKRLHESSTDYELKSIKHVASIDGFAHDNTSPINITSLITAPPHGLNWCHLCFQFGCEKSVCCYGYPCVNHGCFGCDLCIPYTDGTIHLCLNSLYVAYEFLSMVNFMEVPASLSTEAENGIAPIAYYQKKIKNVLKIMVALKRFPFIGLSTALD